MDLTATQEIILQLKKVQKEKNLSIPSIMEKIEGNGDFLSMTTLRRVFAENSEFNDSFNYEKSIQPIARVLLYTDKDQAEDETPALKAIIRLKNEELDRIKTAYEERIREFETRLSFLRDQIELKDKRMDEKDQIIHLLLQKVFPDTKDTMCIRCPMHAGGSRKEG